MSTITKTKRSKVLIFDSGVGGLTIFRAIRELVPDIQIDFASDNAGFPYGTRTEYSLLQRVHKVLENLIDTLSPDLVVIACNSASTLALPSLRAKYDTPFVGVVPAIKPAAELSTSGHIGLLATPATISRNYTLKLIQSYASDKEVTLLGSSELVQMAEDKLRGIQPSPQHLEAILAPLIAKESLDTLVMACTHFPLLLEDMQAHLPQVNHWVESGAAIARRVQSLMPLESKLEPASATKSQPSFQPSLKNSQAWFTTTDAKDSKLEDYLLQQYGLNLNIIPIESDD